MFEGRHLIIATKHQKERVIAPILEKALGVACFTDASFDTDALGTFSGEVERKQDPLSTARLKCLKAMELNNCDLGLASEGSFGAHPSIFFASADEEFLIFIDKKNKLEIIVKELSTETNFNGKSIKNENELLEFAHLAQFPSHALILKPTKSSKTDFIKGINTKEDLISSFYLTLEKHGSAFVETDMRALYNPSRMAVIKVATQKLTNKILSFCPKCKIPGFGITDTKKGLPCDLCGFPTQSTLSLIYQCTACDYSEEKPHPDGKTSEDPMYCDFCNP